MLRKSLIYHNLRYRRGEEPNYQWTMSGYLLGYVLVNFIRHAGLWLMMVTKFFCVELLHGTNNISVVNNVWQKETQYCSMNGLMGFNGYCIMEEPGQVEIPYRQWMIIDGTNEQFLHPTIYRAQVVRAFGMSPKVGGSRTPQVETFSVSKTSTLSKEHLWVENECCWPRTCSNVNFSAYIYIYQQ